MKQIFILFFTLVVMSSCSDESSSKGSVIIDNSEFNVRAFHCPITAVQEPLGWCNYIMKVEWMGEDYELKLIADEACEKMVEGVSYSWNITLLVPGKINEPSYRRTQNSGINWTSSSIDFQDLTLVNDDDPQDKIIIKTLGTLSCR